MKAELFLGFSLLLSSCASEPVERTIVDLSTIGRPEPRKLPARFSPGSPFKRLYAAPASPAEQPAWLERLRAAREADQRAMRSEGVAPV